MVCRSACCHGPISTAPKQLCPLNSRPLLSSYDVKRAHPYASAVVLTRVCYCLLLCSTDIFFHRYASVNLIWFVFAILASRCAGRCRHWYYCFSFLDGVRSGTVNVLDSLFFCCSTVSDSFFVFSGWAVLFRSGALQVERYSCFVFLFFGAGGICTFLGCTYVCFLLYLSMCVFYVLCVGCGVRSAVLCAILIYERNFFNGRGALRVLLLCLWQAP